MKINKYLKGLIVFVIVLLIVVVFWALNQKYNFISQVEEQGITEFVEVKDYKGEDFSDFSDFRENSIKGPQYINVDEYELKIGGLVNQSLSLKYDEVLNNYKSYQKISQLNCVEGWSVKILWEGVLLREVLEGLEIAPEANTIIFKAQDGYTTSFPLGYIMENDIIMAYKMNDEVIPPERGFPFQLVAETKWGYKWIKWITEIEFSDNADYEGFWESRGYSNTGDLDKPKFD